MTFIALVPSTYAVSGSSPDPGNNGTITTANIGVALVNPAGGSRTGCILQAGTIAGQPLIVVNEHATNTVQFAASGTSHVAGGTGITIAGNDKRLFVWDSNTSLWY